ncbi:MAG: hypothetical protein KC636_31955, partial [Myxococcales bacterium]|nr:hypothetical protein [Myxococcales bacterium]
MCASRLRPGRGPTTGARARLRAAILGLRTRGSCAAAFALAPAPARQQGLGLGDEAIEPSAVGPLDDGATLPGTRSVRIARIDVIGNDQVPARIILDPLQDETLVADAALLWPEDPRVERA